MERTKEELAQELLLMLKGHHYDPERDLSLENDEFTVTFNSLRLKDERGVYAVIIMVRYKTDPTVGVLGEIKITLSALGTGGSGQVSLDRYGVAMFHRMFRGEHVVLFTT
jgi:hypothetical protein